MLLRASSMQFVILAVERWTLWILRESLHMCRCGAVSKSERSVQLVRLPLDFRQAPARTASISMPPAVSLVECLPVGFVSYRTPVSETSVLLSELCDRSPTACWLLPMARERRLGGLLGMRVGVPDHSI